MSLTLAALEIHSYLQVVVPPPYEVQYVSKRLTKSTLYNKNHHKLLRFFTEYLAMPIIIPSFFYRLVWLFFNWKLYTVHEMEQAILYAVISCLLLIYLSVSFMMHSNCSVIVHLVNQITLFGRLGEVNLNKFISVKLPMLGNRSIYQLLMYGIAMCFTLLTPAFFAIPFAVPFCPVQLVLGTSLPIKLIAAIFYAPLLLYGGSCVFSIMLLLIICLENLAFYSIYLRRYCAPHSETMSRRKFQQFFIGFRNTQILLKLVNIVFGPFCTALIFVGIFLASSGAYVTVRMYGNIYFLTYFTTTAITVLCFVMALLLTFLAFIPYRHCFYLKHRWASDFNKEVRKILRASQPGRFLLGPYGYVNARLGLMICDDIIRNAVTILLLNAV